MLREKDGSDGPDEALQVCKGSLLVPTTSIRSSPMELAIHFTESSEYSALGRNVGRWLTNVQKGRATARRFGHVLLIPSLTEYTMQSNLTNPGIIISRCGESVDQATVPQKGDAALLVPIRMLCIVGPHPILRCPRLLALSGPWPSVHGLPQTISQCG